MYSVKALIFTSPTCLYCDLLASKLIEIADNAKIPLKVYTVDVEETPEAVKRYDIKTLPTTYIGEERFEGLRDDEEIHEILYTSFTLQQGSPLDYDEFLISVSKPYKFYWHEVASIIQETIRKDLKMNIQGLETREIGDKVTSHLFNILALSMIQSINEKDAEKVLRKSASFLGSVVKEMLEEEATEAVFQKLIEISGKLGLGIFELVSHNENMLVFRIHDCFLCTEFKIYGHKFESPYCIWMGQYLMTSISARFKISRFRETKCMAMGDPYCEFEFYARKER
ncbi:MAG: thioredoxin domain-containing protein [Candidatus Hydrothermarchaeota archaeon]